MNTENSTEIENAPPNATAPSGLVTDACYPIGSPEDRALDIIKAEGKASTLLFQRRMRLGYTRCAQIISTLEDDGIIGPADGARPRDIFI